MKMVNANLFAENGKPCVKRAAPVMTAVMMTKDFYFDIPKRRVFGRAGDVLLTDDTGRKRIVKLKTFLKNYEEKADGQS